MRVTSCINSHRLARKQKVRTRGSRSFWRAFRLSSFGWVESRNISGNLVLATLLSHLSSFFFSPLFFHSTLTPRRPEHSRAGLNPPSLSREKYLPQTSPLPSLYWQVQHSVSSLLPPSFPSFSSSCSSLSSLPFSSFIFPHSLPSCSRPYSSSKI